MSEPPHGTSPSWTRRPIAWLMPVLYLAGLFAVLVGTAALLTPWAFSADALRAEMTAQIRETTGFETTAQGSAAFSLLPQPHVDIAAISFKDPSGALEGQAASLRGYLRILPLFAGRLEIVTATLERPQITIDLDGRSISADGAIGRAASLPAGTQQAQDADAIRLGVLTLVNGNAKLKHAGAADVLVDGIDVTLDWRTLGAPASLTGQVQINDEPTNVSVWVGAPIDLLRGTSSALLLRFNGPALTASSNGTLLPRPHFQYDGVLTASAPSFTRLAKLFGYDLSASAFASDVNIRGDLKLGAGNAALSNMRLHAVGNDLEGSVAVQTNPSRPILSGTLATDVLALTPFTKDIPAALDHDRRWNAGPLGLEALTHADLDLRISATHVQIARFEMTDAALSLMSREGRLEMALAEAKALGGSIKGRLSLLPGEGVSALRGSASATGIDLAAANLETSSGQTLSGRATATATLETKGTSLNDLLAALAGHAEADVRGGEIQGIDLEQALRWIDRRPLALGNTGTRSGRTSFDQVHFGMKIAHGTGEIEDGMLKGPGANLSFGGTIGFGERTFGLNAVATQASTDGTPNGNGPRVRFDLLGRWDDPTFVPEVDRSQPANARE